MEFNEYNSHYRYTIEASREPDGEYTPWTQIDADDNGCVNLKELQAHLDNIAKYGYYGRVRDTKVRQFENWQKKGLLHFARWRVGARAYGVHFENNEYVIKRFTIKEIVFTENGYFVVDENGERREPGSQFCLSGSKAGALKRRLEEGTLWQ